MREEIDFRDFMVSKLDIRSVKIEYLFSVNSYKQKYTIMNTDELWDKVMKEHERLLLKVKYVGVLIYREENEYDLNRQLDEAEVAIKNLREKINDLYKDKEVKP